MALFDSAPNCPLSKAFHRLQLAKYKENPSKCQAFDLMHPPARIVLPVPCKTSASRRKENIAKSQRRNAAKRERQNTTPLAIADHSAE
jgi:hypothetical protein